MAPFAVVALVAFVAVILVGTGSRGGQVIAAGLLVPLLVASVYLVPWWRLPAWAQAAPPLLYFVIVALLRDAAGADASIFTALVLFRCSGSRSTGRGLSCSSRWRGCT